MESRVIMDQDILARVKAYKRKANLGRSVQLSSIVLFAISLYFSWEVYFA